MKGLVKTAAIIVINALVFWAMGRYLPGFTLSGDFRQVLVIASIFTALNFILKPVIKLLFGPIIVLTLGLGLVVVNMLVLYILDRLVNSLTIQGVLTLLYASLIVGVVNFGLHSIFKK
ncbi:MAG: phage holin family protein [Candidatus Liptonbacteria bacterium]|nr:phage holin family protein [Candidatus Liptonbacteria bacterium]